MGDARSQPSDRRQPVSHAHFPLQPAKLRVVFKSVNVADGPALRDAQASHGNAEDLLRSSWGHDPDLAYRGQ